MRCCELGGGERWVGGWVRTRKQESTCWVTRGRVGAVKITVPGEVEGWVGGWKRGECWLE